MMLCRFGDKGPLWIHLKNCSFALLPSLLLKHGSLLPVCAHAALRMDLSLRRILRDVEDGQFPRATNGGFYSLGG